MADSTIENTNQVLMLKLGNEVFGIEIDRVCEVIDMSDITDVPMMPPHLCGVINLRGDVVSIADLAMFLGIETDPSLSGKCIVIVESEKSEEKVVVGALADSVLEVVSLNPEQMEPAPEIGTLIRQDFILGIAHWMDDYFIVLNIEKILTNLEIASLRSGMEERSSDEFGKQHTDRR